MKVYAIGASSMTATYSAGKFVADSAEEAIEKAKENYRKSPVGRDFKDVGAFRFYVTTEETIDG
jgi:hypothetical protein